MRILPACLALCLLAVAMTIATDAGAGVIQFNNPDLVLDTGDCRAGPQQQPGDIGIGVLERYIEQGVHFEIWNEARFFSGVWRHPCDPFQLAQDPYDGAHRYVIVEPEGHIFTDMQIYAGDGGYIKVNSFGGAAITSFRFIGFGPADDCAVVFQMNIPLCPGVPGAIQEIVLADYGLPLGLTSFTLRYVGSPGGAATAMRLVEVTVPEPTTVALLGLGLAALRRRTTSRLRGRSAR